MEEPPRNGERSTGEVRELFSFLNITTKRIIYMYIYRILFYVSKSKIRRKHKQEFTSNSPEFKVYIFFYGLQQLFPQYIDRKSEKDLVTIAQHIVLQEPLINVLNNLGRIGINNFIRSRDKKQFLLF